jgi:hypothetical protein
MYIICVCFRTVASNTYCPVFLLCLSSYCVLYVASFSGLSIFNCPSVFSNICWLLEEITKKKLQLSYNWDLDCTTNEMTATFQLLISHSIHVSSNNSGVNAHTVCISQLIWNSMTFAYYLNLIHRNAVDTQTSARGIL